MLLARSFWCLTHRMRMDAFFCWSFFIYVSLLACGLFSSDEDVLVTHVLHSHTKKITLIKLAIQILWSFFYLHQVNNLKQEIYRLNITAETPNHGSKEEETIKEWPNVSLMIYKTVRLKIMYTYIWKIYNNIISAFSFNRSFVFSKNTSAKVGCPQGGQRNSPNWETQKNAAANWGTRKQRRGNWKYTNVKKEILGRLYRTEERITSSS